MTRQAFWNGLPTTARVGTAVVADDGSFPRYWARAEGILGERIAVVEVNLDGVNYGGGLIWLDDREGSASATVFDRERRQERYVTIEEGSFATSSDAAPGGVS